MKEDNISNVSCYKVRDYFSLKFYSIVDRRAARVLATQINYRGAAVEVLK